MVGSYDAAKMLDDLERISRALGITVRYEPLGDESDSTPTASGLCRLNDRYLLLVDTRLSQVQRCRILAEALAQFEITNIYIAPALRQFIEHHKAEPSADE